MPSHSPKPASHRPSRPKPKRGLILGAAAAVVVVAAVVGVVLASSSKHHTPSGSTPAGGSSTSTSSTPAVASDRCPLTDLPAPGGVVPRRPALAVSIGNEPGGARPQSGLNEADIVYDTPAEGGIMRYVAVFQCNGASSVGPVRSVRWIEWHLLAMYRNLPLLVHAGGINPDLDALDSLHYVKDVDLTGQSPEASANLLGLGQRSASRSAPDNLYTSTSAVWAAFKNEKAPPAPVFDYTASLPSGATPASSFELNFSAGTDGVWTWNAPSASWLHSYAGSGPDVDATTGKQVSATNVVVQIVKYALGPYAESTGGSGDVESVMTGSGKGDVFRDGKEIAVTWHRPTLSAPTTFTDARGQQVGLAPGRTWVEILLDTTAAQSGAFTVVK